MFENRVLRRIFGPKRDEVRREWRRPHHKGELYDLYSPNITYSDNQIKNNGMRGACSTYGERKDAYKILVGKPDGKRPLLDQEDNVKAVFKERDGEAWTRLIWRRGGSGVGD